MYFRQATRADIDLLATLSKRTFFDTFAADNEPADMAEYLASAFSWERIQNELLALESVFILVYPDATSSHEPIGYAHLQGDSAPSCELDLLYPLEVGRLYIEQREIGRGYGSALMQACLDYAEHAGFQHIWLGVWEQNFRAIRFYQKWGFRQIGTQAFTIGKDVQTDLVMMRPVTLPAALGSEMEN